MIHDLKTWPEYFNDIISGKKKFELRENDRNFKVGDILNLREFDPKSYKYTGLSKSAEVIYILEGGNFGLESGHCIMGIELSKVQ